MGRWGIALAIGVAIGVLAVVGLLNTPLSYRLGLKRIEVVTEPLLLERTIVVPATTVTTTRFVGEGEVVTVTQPTTVTRTVTTTAYPKLLTTTWGRRTVPIWIEDKDGSWALVGTMNLSGKEVYVLIKNVTRIIRIKTDKIVEVPKHGIEFVLNNESLDQLITDLVADAKEVVVVGSPEPRVLEVVNPGARKVLIVSLESARYVLLKYIVDLLREGVPREKVYEFAKWFADKYVEGIEQFIKAGWDVRICESVGLIHDIFPPPFYEAIVTDKYVLVLNLVWETNIDPMNPRPAGILMMRSELERYAESINSGLFLCGAAKPFGQPTPDEVKQDLLELAKLLLGKS